MPDRTNSESPLPSFRISHVSGDTHGKSDLSRPEALTEFQGCFKLQLENLSCTKSRDQIFVQPLNFYVLNGRSILDLVMLRMRSLGSQPTGMCTVTRHIRLARRIKGSTSMR